MLIVVRRYKNANRRENTPVEKNSRLFQVSLDELLLEEHEEKEGVEAREVNRTEVSADGDG